MSAKDLSFSLKKLRLRAALDCTNKDPDNNFRQPFDSTLHDNFKIGSSLQQEDSFLSSKQLGTSRSYDNESNDNSNSESSPIIDNLQVNSPSEKTQSSAISLNEMEKLRLHLMRTDSQKALVKYNSNKGNTFIGSLA